MNLSFKQKSLWLMLVSLIAVFGYYFLKVLPGHGANVGPGEVVLFGWAIAIVVILQIAGHIVITIFDRRTEEDERDRLISLKGIRNGYYVLAAGVFLSLSAAVLVEGNFAFTHVLLGFWIASQLVEIVSQLIHYQRGA